MVTLWLLCKHPHAKAAKSHQAQKSAHSEISTGNGTIENKG
jgi:hypothetical protein